jgi:hypothetical protein
MNGGVEDRLMQTRTGSKLFDGNESNRRESGRRLLSPRGGMMKER